MRILVLGAGGTGGYFGGRLAEAGRDVTFLVRPKRATRLAETGLVIESPTGNAHLKIATVTADGLKPGWDLVIVSCKAYDLDDAIAAIRPGVGPDTLILPILNGLAHYGPLDAAFGPERVLGGLCHIFATLGPEGQVRVMNTIHRLTFGERRGGTSPRTEAIAAQFQGTIMQAVHSPELMQEAWEKYTLLTPMAAMTCLMRADIGTIMEARKGEALMRQAYAECEAIAAASGHPPRPKARDLALGYLTERGSRQTASMLRDLEAGSRTEGEHIVGDMVERARGLGQAAPLLEAARCHLEAYEIRRRNA